MLAVLQSQAGLVGLAIVACAAFAVASLAIRRWIVGTDGGDDRAGSSDPGSASIAAVLLGAVLIVPLTFTIALDDAFVLPKITALRLVLLTAVLIVIAGRRAWSPSVRVDTWLDVPVVGFAALTILATFGSIDLAQSLDGEPKQYQGLFTTLLYIAFFLLAREALGTRTRLLLLCRIALVGAAIVAAYALLQALGLDPIWSILPKDRVVSTIGQANALAAYLVLATPLGLVVLLTTTWPRQIAAAVSQGIVTIAVGLTLSRGGYLGFLVAALGPLVWLRAVPRAVWLAAGAVVTLAIVLGAGPLRDEASRIVQRIAITADASESSARQHLSLWTVGGRIALDHPLLGTGPETYPLIFPRYRDAVLPADEAERLRRFRPESPHNVFIAVAAGSGIPALILYLIAIAVVSVRLGRCARDATEPTDRLLAIALLAAICAHLVTDLFMTAEVTGSWLFWLLLGAAASFVRRAGEP